MTHQGSHPSAPLRARVLRFIAPRIGVGLVVFVAITTVSCSREVVLLEPKDSDLVTLNGCVISACNYLAVVKARHRLEGSFWSRVLLVRYANHPSGHAYCVWETEGTIYSYNRSSGAIPFPTYTKDAKEIAVVLARELSHVLGESLVVASAEFIEPSNAKLKQF